MPGRNNGGLVFGGALVNVCGHRRTRRVYGEDLKSKMAYYDFQTIPRLAQKPRSRHSYSALKNRRFALIQSLVRNHVISCHLDGLLPRKKVPASCPGGEGGMVES